MRHAHQMPRTGLGVADGTDRSGGVTGVGGEMLTSAQSIDGVLALATSSLSVSGTVEKVRVLPASVSPASSAIGAAFCKVWAGRLLGSAASVDTDESSSSVLSAWSPDGSSLRLSSLRLSLTGD